MLYGRRNVLWLPWPSGTAVARPSLPVRFLQPHAIQTADGIGLEVVHDPLRRNLRLHHRVHVIAAHMGRQQTPATTRIHLLNRFQNGVATDLVQMIGSLIHTLPLGCRARRIHFQDRGSGHIVLVVDGAGFAAVQVASVADEGDRVNHLTYSYARILSIGRCFEESPTSASRTLRRAPPGPRPRSRLKIGPIEHASPVCPSALPR